jgi:hypothetical protein
MVSFGSQFMQLYLIKHSLRYFETKPMFHSAATKKFLGNTAAAERWQVIAAWLCVCAT